jgi:hypothetical protein
MREVVGSNPTMRITIEDLEIKNDNPILQFTRIESLGIKNDNPNFTMLQTCGKVVDENELIIANLYPQ